MGLEKKFNMYFRQTNILPVPPGFVILDLCKHVHVRIFSEVLASFSGLIKLGNIKEHPSEDGEIRGQRRWQVLLGEFFPLSSALVLRACRLRSHQLMIFCVMNKKKHGCGRL